MAGPTRSACAAGRARPKRRTDRCGGVPAGACRRAYMVQKYSSGEEALPVANDYVHWETQQQQQQQQQQQHRAEPLHPRRAEPNNMQQQVR
jgi:hypothetical protein